VMRGAANRGEQPFAAAVETSHSLFSTQRVLLGVEHSLATGPKPCRLWTDSERARFVRRPVAEVLNSKDEWETKPALTNVSLGEVLIRENDRWVPALALPRMLDGRGFGNLCKLRDKRIYGREIPLAMTTGGDSIAPVKWLRKLLGARDEAEEPEEMELRIEKRVPRTVGKRVAPEVSVVRARTI